jgi:hypothetical protein
MNRAARYGTGIGLGVIHVGALAAFVPAFFHFSDIAVAAILSYLTGVLGVTLCYHRVLTHRSVRLRKPLEYLFAVFGTLALQGDPIRWVAIHRKHHAHADDEGDPHNIRLGFRWAHVDWLYRQNVDMPSDEEIARYAPDLYADPFYRVLQHLGLPLQLVLALPHGWLGLGRLGGLRPPRHRVSLDVAGEQCRPYARLSYLSDHRLFDELLVGRATLFWRGMAQQPPRLSVFSAPRSALVRDRHDVVARRALGPFTSGRPRSDPQPAHASKARLHEHPAVCRYRGLFQRRGMKAAARRRILYTT